MITIQITCISKVGIIYARNSVASSDCTKSKNLNSKEKQCIQDTNKDAINLPCHNILHHINENFLL